MPFIQEVDEGDGGKGQVEEVWSLVHLQQADDQVDPARIDRKAADRHLQDVLGRVADDPVLLQHLLVFHLEVPHHLLR